jgi:hypothetical protein
VEGKGAPTTLTVWPTPVEAEPLCVLPGQVKQLPPAELLDLLDRRRHDERLLGLLRGAAELVLKDPQSGSPGIRPASIQVRVQHLQGLRDKLIQRGPAGLLDRRLAWSAAESA